MTSTSVKRKATNWRIYANLEPELEKDRLEWGFRSIPAFLDNLFCRYFNGETIKRNKRFQEPASPKKQTNYRIRSDVLEKIEKDRLVTNMDSKPEWVNYFLIRYCRGETIKRGQ